MRRIVVAWFCRVADCKYAKISAGDAPCLIAKCLVLSLANSGPPNQCLMPQAAAKNILLIRFSALGDLITIEPIIRAARHFYADSHLTLLTSDAGKQLYEHYVDRCVAVSVPKKHRLANVRLSIRAHFKEQHFDLIIDLQCNTYSMLFGLLLAKTRIVYRSRGPIKKMLGWKSPGKTLPALFIAGGIDVGQVTEYFSEPQHHQIKLELQDVSALQHLDGWSAARSVVALAPGASPGWPTKQWGQEAYAQVAIRLTQENIAVLIVGAGYETPLAAFIKSQCPEVLDLTGKTSIRQLAAVLAQVDLLIGNDSGAAHLAAATGTNTLTIFGPTAVKHGPSAQPYAGQHSSFAPSRTACAPCYKSRCPFELNCLRETTVDKVYEVAMSMLE